MNDSHPLWTTSRGPVITTIETDDLYCMCGRTWHGLPESGCPGTPTAGERLDVAYSLRSVPCQAELRTLPHDDAGFWVTQAYQHLLARVEGNGDEGLPANPEPVLIEPFSDRTSGDYSLTCTDAWLTCL
jgi:hypothetical protein